MRSFDLVHDKASEAERQLDALDAARKADDSNPHAIYRDDPSGFVRDVLHGTSARRKSDGTEYQFEIIDAVATHDHVCMTTGHGVGKSVALAWLAVWWMATRPDGLVLVLAPTAVRQARGIMQREILKWGARSLLMLRTDATAVHCDSTGARLVLLTGAADVGSLEGQHSDSVLLLADESKSLTRDVLDGVAGALTGHEGRTVFASTPGMPSGPHYDAATDTSGTWTAFQIGADNSDRVSDRWLASRAKAWGVQSPTYAMRVRGEYPESGEGVLVSWAALYEACKPLDNTPPLSMANVRGTVLALDVARSVAGDHSCAVLVRDGVVLHVETWREPTLTATAMRAAEIARRFRPTRIVVDEGGVGGGLVDRLRETGAVVVGIHFGQRAFDSDRFTNARAECFWTLKERLEAGTLRLTRDDDLLAELAAQRVTFDAKGRINLAPKDDVRAVLGRSPDRADALALAVAPADPHQRKPTAPSATWVGGQFYANEAWYSTPAGIAYELGIAPEGDPLTWPGAM